VILYVVVVTGVCGYYIDNDFGRGCKIFVLFWKNRTSNNKTIV